MTIKVSDLIAAVVAQREMNWAMFIGYHGSEKEILTKMGQGDRDVWDAFTEQTRVKGLMTEIEEHMKKCEFHLIFNNSKKAVVFGKVLELQTEWVVNPEQA